MNWMDPRVARMTFHIIHHPTFHITILFTGLGKFRLLQKTASPGERQAGDIRRRAAFIDFPTEGNPMKIENFVLLTKEQYPLILGESKYSRRPGNSARELCKRLVHSLAGTRAVIVSGLAQGIDSLCHEAALEESLPTVAVLAQGLASRLDGTRRRLAERILESGGAIVSQFEPDEPAYKGNFPARNKIISGMSCATVIVQSKANGGAMLTGDFCIKEGKPLFAVPGDFDNEVASGTNALLDQGRARPVFLPESLRELLGFPKRGGQSIAALSAIGCNLSDPARALFAKFNGFRKTFDELVSDSGFKTGELLAILTELEIAGLVHTEDNFLFHFNGAA